MFFVKFVYVLPSIIRLMSISATIAPPWEVPFFPGGSLQPRNETFPPKESSVFQLGVAFTPGKLMFPLGEVVFSPREVPFCLFHVKAS